MIGDRTNLMMNSEIVAAVAEGLKLTMVVVDNRGNQCMLGLQRIWTAPAATSVFFFTPNEINYP